MRRIDSRRKLTLSAFVAITVWLIAVIVVVLWYRPQFWVEPSERFERAQTLASARRWVESIASVDVALAAEPDNVGYLVFKGYRQLDVKDNRGAEVTFSRVIAVDRSNADARLGSAAALARLGRRDEALARIETLSPDAISASQLHRRSQLYSELGASRSAVEDLSALLHAERGNPTYLKEAAELALMLNDWDRAASLLQQLNSATTDSAVKQWVAENRAIALAASGREATKHRRHLDAASRYGTLAKENPGDPQFRRAQAHALRAAGRTREAEAVFRSLLADNAADVDTREAYAWQLNLQRRYAEAWKVIEPLPRPAHETRLLELQARTAIWAQQTYESIHLIRALLERRPHDAELWKRLGEAWQKTGDDRQAAAALGSYMRLQSQDWRARERLAQILTKLGSVDEAIAEYQQLVAAEPRNPAHLRSLGLVQETAGKLEAAADSYTRALEATAAPPTPELLLRLARLHRWMGHPEMAIGWYERYLATATDADLRRKAEAELTLSLFDSGNPAAADARLRALGAAAPLDAGELVTAARAATATSQPAAAAKYLELLAGFRTLTPAEERWLAGQYRAAGEPGRALAIYERLATAVESPEAEVFEAIGDLRYDIGDFRSALRAFQRVPNVDAVALKIARTAARAGELALTSDTYERYLRAHPNDVPAHLEAARYNASAGRPHLAIAQYQRFISANGAADLRLELARAHLGAEQFAAAEGWARQALAAGENADEARLALTQSLHLQGRHRDARLVLADLLRAASVHSSTYEWRGYVAAALDRHLDAYRSFDRAIAAGAGEPGKLLILKGVAAAKRGDFARADDSYSAASRSGAVPAAVDAARRDLRALTLPAIYVPMWGLGDSNDLRVTQGGGGVLIFLPSLAGSLALEGSGGALSQRNFSSGINSFTLRLSQLFPTPELKIDLAVGLNQYDRAADLMTWQAGGLYDIGEAVTIGGDLSREGLLAINSRRELRQFSRVLDVQATGPGFYSDLLRGLLEVATSRDRRTRLDTGFERFQDGNRRTFTYLHFQIPTESSARAWTALRPNVFFESFRDNRASYFSPQRHLTIGSMLHTIRRMAGWEIESEINPQLLYTDGATGVGGHGLLNIGAKIGTTSLTGGAFIFWDGLEKHLQWRVGGRVSVPLGR